MASTLAVAALLFVLGLSGSARSDGAVVAANDFYVAAPNYWGPEMDYSVEYTWSSDLPLHLSISRESELITSFEPATSGSGTVKTDGETVFFTWYNPNSENATLSYAFTVVSTGEHMFTMTIWGLIFGAISIFVIIVVVVILLVRGSEKPVGNPPPQQMQPVYAPGPGQCPSCGSSIDADSRFCAKCGAKVR